MSDWLSIFRGRRAFDAVKNLNINHDDINQFQDQCRADFKARVLCLMHSGHVMNTGAYQDWGSQWDRHYCAVNNAILALPVIADVGEQVVEVEAQVTGANNPTGGDIYFYEINEAGTVNKTVDLTAGAANPFDSGGGAYTNVITYTIGTEHINLPMTITADKKYYMYVLAPTNALGNTAYLWWAHVKLQRD